MSEIITRCERHGILNSEPTSMSITYVGNYRPGQMRYCPYCGKKTTIEWPKEEEVQQFESGFKRESPYLPPWKE
jgi:hypothetical protein